MAKEFIVYSKTKAEFEALVSSGEVDTSQMGIIAETGEMWWDGEYRPIAETVPFANDLTGRIEATPEEFTFRPSAGDKSIRDESAFIKKIKGNTIVWNQSAYNGDFKLGTGGWASSTPSNTFSIENGNLVVTTTAETSAGNLMQSRKIKKGVYAICAKWRVISEGYEAVMASGFFTSPTVFFPCVAVKHNEWIVQNMIITATQDYSMFSVGPYFYAASIGSVKLPAGAKIEYEDINVVNLTQMFGAGNEPTTVEEFKALFPDNYYDYNDGELVSMISNGLFANGFNQWDEEWEEGTIDSTSGDKLDDPTYADGKIRSANYIEVLPNTQYYCGKSGFMYWEYDNEYNFIPTGASSGLTPTNGLFTTSSNCRYIRFRVTDTSYKNDICINLSHTGVRNGEYEPYWDATKDLSIIQKYFPNGMRSAGSIYDEISFDEATQKWVAIQRVGVVDLGSLEWHYISSYIGVCMTLLGSKAKGTNGVSTVALGQNFGFADYEHLSDDTLYLNTASSYLYAKFTKYTDAASFKAAMSGVMLYYELAEPIITTIEEPVDLSYKVGDFGIEKMLSDSFSTPFKADIIYQFNVTDRVRENSMNISKLSKKQILLENDVNSLESNALTTDAQTLTADQKAQVAENLGGNTNNGLVRYVDNTLPVETITAPNAIGVTSKYAFPNASDTVKENANGIIATQDFVAEGYIPRPSGQSASKKNKLLAYSDGITYNSGVGIAQQTGDIASGSTDSVPTSGQVKEYISSIIGPRLSFSNNILGVGVDEENFDISNGQKVALNVKTKVAMTKAFALADAISLGGNNTPIASTITLTGGLIDDNTLIYAFPTAPDQALGEADKVLATEDYVRDYVSDNLPTEVATATQLEKYSVTDGSQQLYPNIMYELNSGIGQSSVFVMPNIVQVTNSTYDNRWMLRLPSIATSSSLLYPYTIKWKDGVAPTFSEPCSLEIYLKMAITREILGEWKIYR